ncbi:hypothetical protein FO519_003186 [Halicephalobus sp. NKZ332]|nr:hypothetical protein FO519_003186 [Halicephalobus sp. NKZ332]
MVKIRDRENARTLVLSVDQNGFLSFPLLKQYFPGAIGLVYFGEDGEEEIGVSFDETMTKLLPPADGWNKLFYVVRDSVSSHPPTPATQELTKMNASDFFNYLFYFMEGNTRICVTVPEKDLAMTASHCVPNDKKNGDSLTIFDQMGKPYEVKIVFRNKEVDLVLLQPVEKEFDIEPLEFGSCEVGKPYFALGYLMDEDNGQQFVKSPSVVTGSIMTTVVRKNCVYGNSGGSKGFSGGPVISVDYPRHLIGIAMGGRGLPKSWPTNDFLIRALSFCGETPRLKILPAISAKAVSTTNVKEKGIKRSGTDGDMKEDNE